MREPYADEDPASLPAIVLLNPFFFNPKQFANPSVDMNRLIKARAMITAKPNGDRQTSSPTADASSIARRVLITQPPVKRLRLELRLGARKQEDGRPYSEQMVSGSTETLWAGGRKSSNLKSLIERGEGIEEHVMELWGFEVDWIKSKILLSGPVLLSNNLEAFVR